MRLGSGPPRWASPRRASRYDTATAAVTAAIANDAKGNSGMPPPDLLDPPLVGPVWLAELQLALVTETLEVAKVLVDGFATTLMSPLTLESKMPPV